VGKDPIRDGKLILTIPVCLGFASIVRREESGQKEGKIGTEIYKWAGGRFDGSILLNSWRLSGDSRGGRWLLQIGVGRGSAECARSLYLG